MFHSEDIIPGKKTRRTARAIVVQDGKILLFERWRRNRKGEQLHYFSIPGGGLDKNESPEEAVVREMQEEMLVDVRPIKLLARQQALKRSNYHYYFLCEIVKGTPKFNTASEEGIFRHFAGNRYEVVWMPIEGVGSKMHHGEYRQMIELLPKLLADPHAETVDIVSED